MEAFLFYLNRANYNQQIILYQKALLLSIEILNFEKSFLPFRQLWRYCSSQSILPIKICVAYAAD
jgi:hypothetical protein